MSYLRNKEQKMHMIKLGAAALAVIVLVIIFRAPIGRGFSAVAHGIAWPFLKAKESISGGLSNIGTAFSSKQLLEDEIASLKQSLEEAKLANLERDILFSDNVALREALGRHAKSTSFVAAVILAKPNASPYDTLILDQGSDDGIAAGKLVFARGNVPIGVIDEVYSSTSRAKLFSTPKETTKVVVKGGIYIDMTGTGNGNFEAKLPRDIEIGEGDALTVPSITSEIIAIVSKIVSDPRDPFQKILAKSPVNIQELKFVEVQK